MCRIPLYTESGKILRVCGNYQRRLHLAQTERETISGAHALLCTMIEDTFIHDGSLFNGREKGPFSEHFLTNGSGKRVEAWFVIVKGK